MRLLYVAPRYHTNQVPIMCGWAARGDEVTFCAQFEGISEVHDYVDFVQMKKSWLCKLWFKIIDMCYTPVQAEDKKISAFLPSVLDMVKIVRRVKPDVVILRERTKTMLIAYLVCKFMGIRNVVLYTQTSYERLMVKEKSIKQFFRKLMFPRVIFTPVLYKGKRISTTEKDPHIYYIPLVSDVAENKARGYCSDGCLRMLDIGKYREYKNHFYLIDALKPLTNREDIHLTIIGQMANSTEREYFERLKEAVHQAELDDMVTLQENISYRLMHQVYQEHDILVLPSKNETAGMVILEAMAEKMGVISSNNCGLSCYAEMNDCGEIFPLDNVAKLTEIINKIAENKNIVRTMGENAGKAVNTYYSFNNYYMSFMEMLRKEFELEK